MAIDNLNIYNAGLPAGQLTDRYSSQPGCLRSKNLDIFSSSKSVKATAWSEATSTGSDIVAQDGDLVFKTDGKIYENGSVLINPVSGMPKYNVNYTGQGSTYTEAIWGTPQDMVVKYEGDEWKSFVAFTDRASLTYSKTKYVVSKSFGTISNLTLDESTYYAGRGYEFEKSDTTSSTAYISIVFKNPGIYNTIPIRIYAKQWADAATEISISSIKRYYSRFKYDPELDQMLPNGYYSDNVTYTGDLTTDNGIQLAVNCSPTADDYNIRITFNFTLKEGRSQYSWNNSYIYVDMNGCNIFPNRYMTLLDGTKSDGDYNYYYSYLPLRERKLTDIGEYYWMKGATFQPLYTWGGSWINIEGDKKIRYDFVQYMGWDNDITMDVIGMISWNEQIYMVGNMNGNGYIFPCDLTGGRGTPYIAYGCEFKGVTNIDYLMYLVGEDRGISQLWVYNGQELVPIIGGNKESDVVDIVGVDEQYKFDGRMVEYRGNLVLTTSDSRVFEYGQTYGGKGGVFIHELPSDWTITGLKVEGNDLKVDYEATQFGVTNKYSITYQDDTVYKNYNDTWEATYPIVIGDHLLEKEESDLFVSYILPSADCSLEFWGMANHYHFWTFKSDQDVTLDTDTVYKLKGATGDYSLKFIEKNGWRYTFRLEGDLPVQESGWKIVTDSSGVEVLPYTEFNHFRRIGEITTTGYEEGEMRFHNLNNKLELPKSHSLQIMVRGYGTTTATPELFALDLVANQRERG